jgi:hypothetical protein
MVSGKFEEDESLLREGLVAGFTTYTDVPGYGVACKLYSYREPVGEVIENGWECVIRRKSTAFADLI